MSSEQQNEPLSEEKYEKYKKDMTCPFISLLTLIVIALISLNVVVAFSFMERSDREKIAQQHNKEYYAFISEQSDKCQINYDKSHIPSYDDIENVPKDSYEYIRNQKAKKFTDNLINAIYRGESDIKVKIPFDDNDINPETGEFFCQFLDKFIIKNVKLPIYIDKKVETDTFLITFDIKAQPKRSIFQ